MEQVIILHLEEKLADLVVAVDAVVLQNHHHLVVHLLILHSKDIKVDRVDVIMVLEEMTMVEEAVVLVETGMTQVLHQLIMDQDLFLPLVVTVE